MNKVIFAAKGTITEVIEQIKQQIKKQAEEK